MQTVLPVQVAEDPQAACLPAVFPLSRPSATPPANEMTHVVHWCLARADEWYARGEKGMAREFLRHAADLHPSDPQLWIALGSLDFEAGRVPEAGHAFIRAGQLDPSHPAPYLHLALTHQRFDQWEQSEALLNHALSLQPDNALTLKVYAAFLVGRGRFDEARQYYSQLLVQEPDDIDLLLKVGVCCFRSDDPVAARRCYERIHKLDPSHALAMENLEVIAGTCGNQSDPV